MTHSNQPAPAVSGETGRVGPHPFYIAAWRWHFYAGLYVVPFLIMLAITGLGMMFIAIFDGRDGEKIRIVPGTATVQLEQQSNAALAHVGSGRIVEWIGPPTDDGVSVFRIAIDGGHTMVAVNPYTSEVIDTWDRRAGWYDFLSDIHGTLLIGDLGDRLIEIAAGFGIVLVATGLYLWWPRGGAGFMRALVPDVRARGRTLLKSLHQVIGVWSSLLLVAFLITGMAWAGIWGERFVQAWSTFPAEKWDNVPLSDLTHADLNHGAMKDVPWGLEQTPLPASGSDAGRDGLAAGTLITADTIVAFARRLGFEGRFRLGFPNGETGVWTLSRDSMSNDSSNPLIDRTVHIDQYSGKILADVGFADYSLPAKGMAVGIAFHEGDLGLWNIILNTVFCLGVVFICVSGIVMWWMRRPSGATRLVAPPLPANLPLWRGAIVVMLLVSLAFPLVGLTLLAVLAFDLLVLQSLGSLRRVLQ